MKQRSITLLTLILASPAFADTAMEQSNYYGWCRHMAKAEKVLEADAEEHVRGCVERLEEADRKPKVKEEEKEEA